jgi:hypothetical protein
MRDRERNVQSAVFFGAIIAMFVGIMARTNDVPIPGLALAGGLELWLGWRQISTGKSYFNRVSAGDSSVGWSYEELEKMEPGKRSVHAVIMGLLSILFGLVLLYGELSFAVPGLFR